MNYRSHICLVLSKKGNEILNDLFNDERIKESTRNSGKEFFNNANMHCKTNLGKSSFWIWNNIVDYDEITEENNPGLYFLIDDVVSYLMQDGQHCEYLYIRIGQDTDDIEYDGGYFNNPFGIKLNVSIDMTSPKCSFYFD